MTEEIKVQALDGPHELRCAALLASVLQKLLDNPGTPVRLGRGTVPPEDGSGPVEGAFFPALGEAVLTGWDDGVELVQAQTFEEALDRYARGDGVLIHP